MAYPQQSNWTQGLPYSAWYVDAPAGKQPRACQTDGWSFLRDLQETLQTRLSNTGPLPSVGGQPISANAILINDPTLAGRGWDSMLLRALYAVAARDRAPAAFLQAVGADALAGRVSAPTLRTAIWVAYLSEGRTSAGRSVYGQGSPAEVQLPADAVLPQWMVVPSLPPTGVTTSGINCHAVPNMPAPVAPLPGWQAFLANPWVLVGMIVVGTAGAIAASRNIPRVRSR